jgi:ABC-type transporter Mla maintaining outer membrane lipid asymmetry ATPase subunit MlaF
LPEPPAEGLPPDQPMLPASEVIGDEAAAERGAETVVPGTPGAKHGGGEEVLRVEHLTKSFGPTHALRDINLTLHKGEVLGLLGDNGSGKSTLIKTITGFHKQDSGRMFLHDKPYEPKNVEDARAHGIDTVFQDLALID